MSVEKGTVLFLPTINAEWGIQGWDEDVFKQMLETVCRSVNKKNFNLIIKLHPSADYGLYENIEGAKDVWLTRDADLLDLIRRSDLIIAEPSTAVIPCVLLKKPIIHIRLISNAGLGFDYSKYNVGVVCRTQQQLDELLEKRNKFNEFVNHNAYDVFEKEFCNYGKKKTSKLIADYIEKTLMGCNLNKSVTESSYMVSDVGRFSL